MDRIEAIERQKEALQLWEAGRQEEALRLVELLCSAFPKEQGLVRLRVRWLVALRRYEEALAQCVYLTRELKDPEGPVLTAHLQRLRERSLTGDAPQGTIWASKRVFRYLALAAAGSVLLLIVGAWGIHYLSQRAARFPRGPSVGQIYVRQSVGEDWRLLAEARGRVVLPANRRFRLVLASPGETALDLAFLDAFGSEELTDIEAVGSRLGDAGTAHLARHTGLEYLGLRRTGVTDKGMPDLAGLTALRHLDLSENAITDEGLGHLSNLRALDTLCLPEGATDATLTRVSGFPALKTLECARTGVSSKGVSALAEAKALRNLNLSVTNIGDADLAVLRRLPALEQLDVSRARISDRGLQALGGWNTLKSLNIAGTNVTDTGIEALAGLPALNRLDASVQGGRPRLSERAVESMAKFPALRELRLDGALLPESAVARLGAERPGCQIEWEPSALSQVRFPARHGMGMLWIRPVDSTSEQDWVRHAPAQGAVDIPAGKALRLDVRAETPPDTLLCGLAALAKGPFQLQALRFPENTAIDIPLWEQLTAFPALRELDCSGVSFSDMESGGVAPLGSLSIMDLSKTTPPAGVLAALAQQAALKTLDLSGVSISDAELDKLRQALPTCQLIPPAQPTRTLEFPADPSMGTLWMRAAREKGAVPWTNLGAAQGAVTAPASAFIGLEAAPGPIPAFVALKAEQVPLDALALPGYTVRDADLQAIAALSSAQSLDLFGTSLTASGLQQLSSMAKLRRLVLARAAFSPGALQSLPTFPVLEELDLAGTGIQDADLAALRSCAALKILYLNGCPLSGDAVAQFRAARPDCRVVTSLPPPPPPGNSARARTADPWGAFPGHSVDAGCRCAIGSVLGENRPVMRRNSDSTWEGLAARCAVGRRLRSVAPGIAVSGHIAYLGLSAGGNLQRLRG